MGMQRGRYNHAIVGVNLGAICHIATSTEAPTETLTTTEASGTAETTSSAGDAGTIYIRTTDLVLLILVITGSLFLLALLTCLACFCYRRSIHSNSVKNDINNDNGIYPESGDVVMEVVNKNNEV